MNWRIAEAKQGFSKLIDASREQPQLIYKRDRPVAAVVEIETFRQFLDWQKHVRRPSVADGAARVRQACVEEGHTFELPERVNRPNPFADALDDLPR